MFRVGVHELLARGMWDVSFGFWELTWGFMGSYKWDFEAPTMGYN